MSANSEFKQLSCTLIVAKKCIELKRLDRHPLSKSSVLCANLVPGRSLQLFNAQLSCGHQSPECWPTGGPRCPGSSAAWLPGCGLPWLASCHRVRQWSTPACGGCLATALQRRSGTCQHHSTAYSRVMPERATLVSERGCVVSLHPSCRRMRTTPP